MIEGTVTDDREMRIPLEILDKNDTELSIEAIVDTGFNGFLTLPADLLAASGGVAVGTRRAELGNGEIVEMAVYIVRVKWHDQVRDAIALKAESILIGMSMLWGSRVTFDAQDAGLVTIELIS